MTDIGEFGPITINERGWVIGRAENEAGTPRAGLWRDGELIDLGTLGGAWSQASTLNDRGEIVGQSVNANGELHAFLWRQRRMIDLGVPVLDSDPANPLINNSGQIAGRAYGVAGPQGSGAFLWENGVLTDLGTLPGSTRSYVVAINDRGQILGMSDDARIFLWRNGRMSELNALRGRVVRLMNNSGHIVGNDENKADNSQTSWLWRRGERLDLGSHVAPVALNDRGQVVGFQGGFDTGRAVLWTVPQ
jgi:probable HAF family extracellular repeat protein